MDAKLPRLRNDLDIMPSPVREQPGLLLRDPYRYTQAMAVIPPALVPALTYLDGESTERDLQAFLTRQVGEVVPREIVQGFVSTLQQQGFLETPEYFELRQARQREFRNLAVREAAHAGSAYPEEAEALRQQLRAYISDTGGETPAGGIVGLAAPHVSPFGGWRSYGAAYGRLACNGRSLASEKTFVILGTSHYGAPETFGLTRKPFVTPLGELTVDVELVDRLASRGGEAVVMEDYCHAIEHSIEFQCVFLQHVFGRDIRIVPILCGPFWESLQTNRPPESNAGVARFIDALGELAAEEGERLFFILGVDLAHIGRRYGDRYAARADHGRMVVVGERDRQRLERICEGDAAGFGELIRPQRDELRWCGYSALYTFLKATPDIRGKLLRYEQWNIDGNSVVSFAAVEFFRAGAVLHS